MRDLVWSDDALQEFDETIFYVARDNPQAAVLVADRIEATAELLARSPVGRPGRVKGTYEKPVLRTQYVIAYALSDRAVTILRIIHTSRDWPSGKWPEK